MWAKFFWENFLRGYSTWGINYQNTQMEGGVSQMRFPVIWKLKSLPIMKGYTLEDKALTSLQNYDFSISY